MFELTPDHLTGVPEVDNLNKKLIDNINLILEADTTRSNLGTVLALQALVIKHFQHEEAFVYSYTGVPCEYHFEIHSIFRKALTVLKEHALKGTSMTEQLKKTFIPKFLNHILIEDFILYAHIPELRKPK